MSIRLLLRAVMLTAAFLAGGTLADRPGEGRAAPAQARISIALAASL